MQYEKRSEAPLFYCSVMLSGLKYAVLSDDARDGPHGDALEVPLGADALRGGGLDTYAADGQARAGSDVLPHSIDERRELGLLRDDRRV